MKFSDIPQFTKRPSHHINIGFDYINEWINSNIDELGLQLNPDFQRGHVWTQEQQIAYVEYLLRGGASGKDFYFNRVGGMSDFRNQKADFVCVDGLQRITAILSFLHNEIPAFNHYFKDFEDRLRMISITLDFYVNDIINKKDVLLWYLEMNFRGTPHTKEELDKVKKMIEGD